MPSGIREPLKKQSPSHPRPLSLAVRVEPQKKNTRRSLRPSFILAPRDRIWQVLYSVARQGESFCKASSWWVHVHSPCFPRTLRVLFYIRFDVVGSNSCRRCCCLLLLRCGSACLADRLFLFSFLHFFARSLFRSIAVYWFNRFTFLLFQIRRFRKLFSHL